MRACEILPRILIDNLHCFKHTWNSNVDAYHGKWAFMPSSVLALLPNFKSTYFASLNPPIVHVYCALIRSILEYAPAVFADLPKYLACYLENVQQRVLSNPFI